MSNKKNEKKAKNQTETKKETFLYKYKNDTKYKAKVELTGYVVFILFIILFVNIASLGNSPTSSNLANEILSNSTNNNTTTETEKHLLDEINNNYQYDINIHLAKTTEEIINYHYYGKSYEDTLEINKEANNTTNTYYKVGDYYYQKEEGYIIISSAEIYDLITNNYIELESLLEYIDEASLDHVTNYSSGKKESVYNLYIRDIIISNKTDDMVTINVIEENDTLSISVDYFNLIKQIDNTVKECKVNYTFSNINEIETFSITTTSSAGEVNE